MFTYLMFWSLLFISMADGQPCASIRTWHVRMTSVLDFVRTVTGEFETVSTTSVSLFGIVLKLVKAFVVHISF